MPHAVSLISAMQPDRREAGCDEAGRGPIAGPVYAAAVILPAGFHHPLLNDSKKMSRSNRDKMRAIIERDAEAWAVAAVSAEEIDELNILRASISAMQQAVRKLGVRPDFLLIDGNRFMPFDGYSYATVVHGDATYASIAAASVLAKTWRDEKMEELSRLYPGYGWERNAGYGTREHVEAIKRLGYTPQHRRSFHLKELEPTLF